MDNDIIVYTTGFLVARLAVLGGFCYGLYHVLRPRRVAVRSAPGGDSLGARRADSVFDDRC